MKYCFVFVCQQGELEIKASFLNASLHRYLKCDHELVAAIPTPEERWGKPADHTKAFLKKIGVRFISIRNQIDEKYPIGNKASCLLLETSADKIIFLDKDSFLIQIPLASPTVVKERPKVIHYHDHLNESGSFFRRGYQLSIRK